MDLGISHPVDSTGVWKRAMATSHRRYVELERIMAMPLTQDEQIVLRHLISGESSEEIAATLDWPLQVVRNCTHTLITWVLDGLEERGRTPTEYLPAPPPVA
jgi:DNA-directed RNA polymerase specialized sigma24 family protein